MKVEELRIGNYVNLLGEDCTIIGILQDVFYVQNAQGNNYKSTWGDVKPMPITEELLFSFGFEMFDYLVDDDYDDDFIYIAYKLTLKNKRCYYSICEDRDGFFDFCLKLTWRDEIVLSRIQYAHQLQNICFVLMNEDLETKQHEK
jgi:hypothetical protein